MFWLIKRMFMGLLISIVNASSHTKCVSLSNQKCITQPTLINFPALIYILMNTVKNLTTIHSQLNYTNVLEVVILLMTYLIKNVFQIK